MKAAHGFRRLVVDLSHPGAGAASLRVSASVARLLRLDLVGVFVEDEALHALAGLPFVRELRLPSPSWRPLDLHRIAAETTALAAQARRLLLAAGATAALPAVFEWLRGDPASAVAALACEDDILALPARPGRTGRLEHQPPRQREAALRCVASVLLLPYSGTAPSPASPAKEPEAGSIAVLAGQGGRAVDIAARIALEAGATLLLLGPPDSVASMTRAKRQALAMGLPVERLRSVKIAAPVQMGLARALAGEGVRLLALDRQECIGEAAGWLESIAAERGVPVLVVEPTATT